MAFSNSKPGMAVMGLIILGSGFLIALLLIALGQSILANLIRERGAGWVGGGGGGGMSNEVPEHYRKIFGKAGPAFKVQPAFLAAIFYAGEHGESWPDPNGPWANSQKGAQGPFQFIPSTWAGHQQDGGGDTYREDSNGIPDGKKNVQSIWDATFGASHLLAANGAEDFTTNLDKLRDAASRYNSGCQWEPDPNASRRCRLGGQAFEETKKYIARVIPAFQRFFVSTALAASNFPVELTANPAFDNDWLAPRAGHLHAGIDIKAPRDTALIAVSDGTIEGLEEGDGWGGLKFWLNPGGEQKYYYAHIINPQVKNGQRVGAGEILAGVGTANGVNHLHFGIAVQKQQEGAYHYAGYWWINPYQFLVNLKGNR